MPTFPANGIGRRSTSTSRSTLPDARDSLRPCTDPSRFLIASLWLALAAFFAAFASSRAVIDRHRSTPTATFSDSVRATGRSIFDMRFSGGWLGVSDLVEQGAEADGLVGDAEGGGADGVGLLGGEVDRRRGGL